MRPTRGGFLRPFGCGWFIRELLLGHGPNGSPRIDPDVGAPQSDIFYYYKTALLKAAALDRATMEEERQAGWEKRAICPEEIERLTVKYLARIANKTDFCRYHSFVVYFSILQRLWQGQLNLPIPPAVARRMEQTPASAGASPYFFERGLL